MDALKIPYRIRRHPVNAASKNTLAEDLEDTRVMVTWCSTSAVEAVLAGVPTVAFDEYSVAWDVTSHDLIEEPWRGDREQWCYDLAYRQWTKGELAGGAAWEWFKYAMECNDRADN